MLSRTLLKFREEIAELQTEVCNIALKVALLPEDQKETSSGDLGHHKSINLYSEWNE